MLKRSSGKPELAGKPARPTKAAEPVRNVPIAGPSITDKEVDYITEAAREGWHENYLKHLQLFEEQFAAHSRRRYAIATSSGTGALHLAYAALGLGGGDEVIVPNVTWIASIDPAVHMGVAPVFADIERDTWCLDPNDIEHRITKKTKAILAVHLYGHAADMGPILDIAQRHGLAVIEDAAQAVGGTYKGRPNGSFGKVSAVSFTGTKTMVTGEGGMLLTNDAELYERATLLNDHSQDPDRKFWNVELGYKYKMSNIQAALGIAQLERLDELVARKRQIFGWYQERLGGVAELQLNAERPGVKSSFWMTTVVFDAGCGIEKEALMERLAEHGIQSRPFFYPLSELPPFRQTVDTPVSLDLAPRGINLPSAHDLEEDDVDYVCEKLLSILGV